MSTPDPVEEPILHSPWEEPTSHYRVNPARLNDLPVYMSERRPSQPSLVDLGRTDNDEELTEHDEPYATINEIRKYVADWREGGFRGTPAQKLLARWQDEANDPHGDTRAYFCQREAVETIVWLLRDHQDEPSRRIAGRLREINAVWNDGLNRMAVKMATGSGKTRAMTMLIGCLEKLHPDGCTVVIINPNLTVQDRLQTILEDIHRSDIVPHFDKSLTKANVKICNFHKFRQRDESFTGLGKAPTGFEKKVLGSVERLESPKMVIDRLLDEDFNQLPLYVFQDEGHHCRRRVDQVQKGNLKDEELDDEGQWFNALLMLQRERNLQAIIDFSATPAYLVRPGQLKTAIFPWVVSDFGIEDAIEAGICKIPRLPIPDSSTDSVSGISNLYHHCIDEHKQKAKWGKEPPQEVKELMRALAKDWVENRLIQYQEAGRVPAVIVVVNSVHNAIVLYNWVSGSKSNDGSWVAGQIPEFSNIEPTTGMPISADSLPTIMAHSRITDGGEDLNTQAKQIIRGQRELRAPDATSDNQASDVIRDIFSSVGVPGAAGEKIRCVISVSMLSEGWDAKTVTHVFGFRRFNSVLLIEQVVGRALRRVSLDAPSEAEYAEIFGVPYPGRRRGRGSGATPTSPVPRTVESLAEQSEHQITWPNVRNLAVTIPEGQRFRLIPEKVSKFEPELADNLLLRLREPTGHGEEHVVSSNTERHGKVMFQLASGLADLWLQSLNESKTDSSTSLNRRGLLFVDAKRALEAWLDHELIQIKRIDLLAEIELFRVVIEEVARCCVNEEGAETKFTIEFEPGTKTSDTSNRRFQTTLREFVEPLKKSHLNAAACHSSWESEVARDLDKHNAVKSWVRNFRLDWRIPWWDTRMGTWREYEPDFVAVMDSEHPHHVVVEVKGLEDPASEIKKEAAEQWCDVLSASEDPSAKGKWSYLYITDPSQTASQINELIGEAI